MAFSTQLSASRPLRTPVSEGGDASQSFNAAASYSVWCDPVVADPQGLTIMVASGTPIKIGDLFKIPKSLALF